MALLKRLLRVRTTNDKILEVYLRENNDSNDGIYYNEIDRNTTVTPGTQVTGTNIIPKSTVFPGEDVKNLILDTNHIDQPSGYIISLCFYTDDGTNSKLYMGRVTGGTTPTWTQCADSPKEYNDKIITAVFSSFLNTSPVAPVKFVNRRDLANNNNEDVIIERH